MARIRTIKPEFPEDETLGGVTRDARFTFVLLWTRCDDHGRFRAAAPLLRGQLYPYDEDLTNNDLDQWLAELVHAGRIQVYDVDGQRYGQIINWGKHQRIDNAAKSAFPEPPEDTPHTFSANRGEPRRTAANRGEPPLEGKGREGKGKDHPVAPTGPEPATPAAPTDRAPQAVRDVFDTWIKATGKNGRTRLDHKRQRLIRKALDAYPLEDVQDAVQGWRNSPHHRGDNDRGTTYNDLELLLRDAAHIEKFRDLNRTNSRPPANTPRTGFKPLTDEELARLEGKTA